MSREPCRKIGKEDSSSSPDADLRLTSPICFVAHAVTLNAPTLHSYLKLCVVGFIISHVGS